MLCSTKSRSGSTGRGRPETLRKRQCGRKQLPLLEKCFGGGTNFFALIRLRRRAKDNSDTSPACVRCGLEPGELRAQENEFKKTGASNAPGIFCGRCSGDSRAKTQWVFIVAASAAPFRAQFPVKDTGEEGYSIAKLTRSSHFQ